MLEDEDEHEGVTTAETAPEAGVSRPLTATARSPKVGSTLLSTAVLAIHWMGGCTCTVKHGEIGPLGAALRRSQGFSAESEVLGLSF